jgi:hypothetical protein
MRSSRIPVVAGLLLCVGLGVLGVRYLTGLVGQSSQHLVAVSQGEVWAQAWAEVKLCLLGEEPALADPGAALLFYEATHPDGGITRTHTPRLSLYG